MTAGSRTMAHRIGSWAAALAASMWAGDKIGWQIRTDAAAGLTPIDIADRFWTDLWRHPLHISMERTDIACGALACLLLLLCWAWKASTRLRTRTGEEHGSAKWGREEDIAPYQAPRRVENLHFTRSERLDLHSLRRNLNVLAIGSSGSGKTRSYVRPNLLNGDSNWAATDPKGELLRDTGQAMRDKGYRVDVLDLIHLSASEGFNPMRYIDPEEPEPAILRLVDNLISNTSGDNRDNGDGFWERAERALLTALTAWVYYTEDGVNKENGRTVDNRSLNKVTDMVGAMSASEEDETAESIIDAYFAEARAEIANMDSHPERYDAESRAMLGGLRFACAQYQTFLQGAGETKKSIIISLGVRLAPLQVANVRRILGHDELDLDTLDEGRRALYLELSDTDSTFAFLAAILYQSLFETLVRKADRNENGRLERGVHCMLDEFANIGKIPNFVRLIATIRSRGISASIILQSWSQGKSLYRDDWETIAGNCDSWLFLGGAEESTTKIISQRLGNETIDVVETSESKGSSGGWSRSVRKNERALMDPAELALLPGDTCIYMLRGVRPFISLKIDPDKPLPGKN